MEIIKLPFFALIFLFLFLTSSDLQAQNTPPCREDCDELAIIPTPSDCPCELDIKAENVQLVGTIDPCHCHIFRTLVGVYVKEVRQRNGETIIQMSRNLSPGTQTRLFQVNSRDVSNFIDNLFIELEQVSINN